MAFFKKKTFNYSACIDIAKLEQIQLFTNHSDNALNRLTKEIKDK